MTPIAVVEDDSTTRHVLRIWLEKEGFQVDEYASGLEAIERMKPGTTVVCLDLGLGDLDGVEVLRRLLASEPTRYVIVTTANTEVATVVEAMKTGAFDYITKPIDGQLLVKTIKKAQAHRAIHLQGQAPERLKQRIQLDLNAHGAVMREVVRHILRILENNVAVFLYGESGVGKATITRLIHERSQVSQNPLVLMNCATTPQDLHESTLFGQGADSQSSAGKIEQAQNGTLVLENIEELSPSAQIALLRLLQENTVARPGGNSKQPLLARLISTNQRDLIESVRTGHFREDLYYRLMVYPIRIPPLRERIEDLPGIVGTILRGFSAADNSRVTRISSDALDALARHSWPGNIRELANTLQCANLASQGAKIGLTHLPREIQELLLSPLPRPPSNPPLRSLRELEREAIRSAISASGGNMSAAAKILGVSRATLYRRLNEERDLERGDSPGSQEETEEEPPDSSSSDHLERFFGPI